MVATPNAEGSASTYNMRYVPDKIPAYLLNVHDGLVSGFVTPLCCTAGRIFRCAQEPCAVHCQFTTRVVCAEHSRGTNGGLPKCDDKFSSHEELIERFPQAFWYPGFIPYLNEVGGVEFAPEGQIGPFKLKYHRPEESLTLLKGLVSATDGDQIQELYRKALEIQFFNEFKESCADLEAQASWFSVDIHTPDIKAGIKEFGADFIDELKALINEKIAGFEKGAAERVLGTFLGILAVAAATDNIQRSLAVAQWMCTLGISTFSAVGATICAGIHLLSTYLLTGEMVAQAGEESAEEHVFTAAVLLFSHTLFGTTKEEYEIDKQRSKKIKTYLAPTKDIKEWASNVRALVREVFEAVYELWTGEPYPDEVQKLLSDMAKWVDQSAKIVRNLEVFKLGFDSSVTAELRDQIYSGDHIMVRVVKSRIPPNVSQSFAMYYTKIRDLELGCRNAQAFHRSRPRPWCVQLWGEPGHGKSTLSLMIAASYLALTKQQLKGNVYNKPGGDKFWSGYKGQAVVIKDDTGQNQLVEQQTLEAEEIIQMINTVYCPLNMAGLDEKGNVAFVSQGVILSSQDQKPWTNARILNKTALDRRRDIVVHVKSKKHDGKHVHGAELGDWDHYTLTLCNWQTGALEREITFEELMQEVLKLRDEYSDSKGSTEAVMNATAEKVLRTQDAFLQVPVVAHNEPLHSQMESIPEQKAAPVRDYLDRDVNWYKSARDFMQAHNFVGPEERVHPDYPPIGEVERKKFQLSARATTRFEDHNPVLGLNVETKATHGFATQPISQGSWRKKQSVTAEGNDQGVWERSQESYSRCDFSAFLPKWFSPIVEQAYNTVMCELAMQSTALFGPASFIHASYEHIKRAYPAVYEGVGIIYEDFFAEAERLKKELHAQVGSIRTKVEEAFVLYPALKYGTMIVTLAGFAATAYYGWKAFCPTKEVAHATEFEIPLITMDRVAGAVAQIQHSSSTSASTAPRVTFVTPAPKIAGVTAQASVDSQTEDALQHKIGHQIVNVTAKNPIFGEKHMMGLGLFDGVMVMPYHFFMLLQQVSEGGCAEWNYSFEYKGRLERCSYDKLEMRVVQDDDKVFIKLPKHFARFSDITRHLITEKDLSKDLGEVIMARRRRDKDLNTIFVQTVNNFGIDHEGQQYALNLDRFKAVTCRIARNFYGDVTCQVGDCGSIYLANSPFLVGRIIGFHTAGRNRSYGVGTFLTYEHASEACKGWGFPSEVRHPLAVAPVLQTVAVPLPQLTTSNGETEVQAHMEIATTMLGPGAVKVSTLPPLLRIGAAMKTKIMPTPLRGKIHPSIKAPARMRPFVKEDGETVSPFLWGLQRQTSVLEIAEEARPWLFKAAEGVLRAMPAFTGRSAPLSDHEIWNGRENEPYMKPVNRNTSAGPRQEEGAPHRLSDKDAGGKHKWLPGDPGQIQAVPEVMEGIAKLEEQLAQGPVTTHWTVHGKDELLKLAKVAEGKTRLTHAGTLEFLGVARKYFLEGSNAFMKAHKTSWHAVGINPHSRSAWSTVYTRIHKWVQTNLMMLDIENMDGSMAVLYFTLVAHIWSEWMGGTEREKTIRKNIIISLAHSRRYFMIYEILCEGGNPSGQPLTAQLNSTVTMILSAAIFMFLCFKNCGSATYAEFDENVGIVVFGDDNTQGVNPACPWYNQKTVIEVSPLFGFRQQDALKKGNPTEYVRLDELEFLKRGFRSDGQGFFFAPLSQDSLQELVQWARLGQPQKTVVELNCRVAAAEWFHYGRERYDIEVKALNRELTLMGCTPVHFEYSDWLEAWLDENRVHGICGKIFASSDFTGEMHLDTIFTPEVEGEALHSQMESDETEDEIYVASQLVSAALDDPVWCAQVNRPRTDLTEEQKTFEREDATDTLDFMRRTHADAVKRRAGHINSLLVSPMHIRHAFGKIVQDGFEKRGKDMDRIRAIHLATHSFPQITFASAERMLLGRIDLYKAEKATEPLHAQGPTGEQEEKSKEGLISGIAERVSAVGGALSGFPVIGQFAQGVGAVAGVVAKVAKFFGFDKPISVAAPIMVVQTSLPDHAHGKGLSNAVVLALDPAAKTADAPIDIGAAGDDMDIQRFVSVPGFLQLVSVNPSTTEGAVFCAHAVTPMAGNYTVFVGPPATVHVPATRMNYVGSFFDMWQGDIEITLVVSASDFVSFRLRVSLHTEGSTVPTSITTRDGDIISAVFDITGSTTLKFTVPMLHRHAWLRTGTPGPADVRTGTVFGAGTTNGFFCLSVASVPNQPNTLSTGNVWIAVFSSGGKNLKFSSPMPLIDGITMTTGLFKSGSKTPDKESWDVVRRRELHAQMDTGAPSLIPSNQKYLEGVYVPEQVNTMKALFKRFDLVGTPLTRQIGGSVYPQYYFWSGPVQPYGELARWCQAFRYWRGTMIFSFAASDFTQISSAGVPVVSMAPQGIVHISRVPTQRWSNTLITYADLGGVEGSRVWDLSQNATTCVAIPYYGHTRGRPTTNTQLLYDTTNTWDTLVVVSQTPLASATGGAKISFNLITYQAIGDDFVVAQPVWPGTFIVPATIPNFKTFINARFPLLAQVEEEELHAQVDETSVDNLTTQVDGPDERSVSQAVCPPTVIQELDPYPPSGMDGGLTRQYFVGTYTYSTAQSLGTIIAGFNVPYILTHNQPKIQDLLNNYSLLNTGVEVTFSAQPTAAHQGTVMANWTGQGLYPGDQIYANLPSSGTFGDYALMSLNPNPDPAMGVRDKRAATLTVRIPFSSMYKAMKTSNFNVGSIALSVLTPLEVTMPDASSSVQITVRAALYDCRLAGPTLDSTVY